MYPGTEVKRILSLYMSNPEIGSDADKLLQECAQENGDTWVFQALAALKIALPANDVSLIFLAGNLPAFRRNHLKVFDYCRKALGQAGNARATSLKMAKDALDAATADRPNHPVNAVCKAELCLAEGNHAERFQILEKLLCNRRYRHYASALLAPIYLEEGKISSLSIMRQLYDPDATFIYCGLPREHHIYFAANLAFVSSLVTEYEKTWSTDHIFEAANILNRSSYFGQSNPIYFQFIGDCLLALKQYQKARLSYTRSIELEEHPAAISGLALVELAEGNLSAAKKLAENALSIEPNFFAGRYARALVYTELKDFQDAVEELDGLLELRPTHIGLMEKLGAALVASDIDAERGESLLVFARQQRTGAGSRDEEGVAGAIRLLGKLTPD